MSQRWRDGGKEIFLRNEYLASSNTFLHSNPLAYFSILMIDWLTDSLTHSLTLLVFIFFSLSLYLFSLLLLLLLFSFLWFVEVGLGWVPSMVLRVGEMAFLTRRHVTGWRFSPLAALVHPLQFQHLLGRIPFWHILVFHRSQPPEWRILVCYFREAGHSESDLVDIQGGLEFLDGAVHELFGWKSR